MNQWGPFYCVPCRQWSDDSFAHIHPMREERIAIAHDQAFDEDARREVDLLLGDTEGKS